MALSSVKQTTYFAILPLDNDELNVSQKQNCGRISQYTRFRNCIHWFLLEKCFDLFRTLLKQLDPPILRGCCPLERQNSNQHINKHNNKAKNVPYLIAQNKPLNLLGITDLSQHEHIILCLNMHHH